MGIKRKSSRFLISFVIVMLSILSIVGIYQFKRAENLALAVENQYVHSFHEMADYVKDVDVLLKKTILVTEPRQLSSLAADIYMQTAAAKANLAMLPITGNDFSNTSKFLSQAGDYTAYLAKKVINDGVVTEEEYKNLSSLSDFAGQVNQHLSSLENQLYEQRLSFRETNQITVHADNGDENFNSRMETLEKSFQDYPTLIYDGPFSEHIEHLKPLFLENRLTINQSSALAAARSFCGGERAELLSFTGEGNGTIKTYDFMGQDKNGREISVSVTKKGGYILYMLDNRAVTETNLSIQQAQEKAMTFLKKNVFFNMRSSYYETDGHCVTFNFAAVQDDIILYSDLIKVKVALDNGEILGFESNGYLMNHKERVLPTNLISEDEIKNKISPHLVVESVQLAMIPLDSKREVLTYECKGRYNNDTFLIYINAETGDEEKILMLMQTENGMLTI